MESDPPSAAARLFLAVRPSKKTFSAKDEVPNLPTTLPAFRAVELTIFAKTELLTDV